MLARAEGWETDPLIGLDRHFDPLSSTRHHEAKGLGRGRQSRKAENSRKIAPTRPYMLIYSVERARVAGRPFPGHRHGPLNPEGRGGQDRGLGKSGKSPAA